MEIDFNDIVVGQQYQLNNKYYLACDVTIVAKEFGEDKETLRGPNWVGFKVRIDSVIFGSGEIGDEFSVGYDTEYPAYKSIKFKSVGSMTDYIVGIDLARGESRGG